MPALHHSVFYGPDALSAAHATAIKFVYDMAGITYESFAWNRYYGFIENSFCKLS